MTVFFDIVFYFLFLTIIPEKHPHIQGDKDPHNERTERDQDNCLGLILWGDRVENDCS